MRNVVSVWGSVTALFLCAVLTACGISSGSGGGSKTPPPPIVTSVSVSPASVTVFTGTTQQFTAAVAGSAGVSTAVTWSVVGEGNISDSGLFTAGSISGSATVMAASQEDPSVTGSSAVTVSNQPVAWGNWYGTLVSSDGTQTFPMDFSLTRTGNILSTTHNYAVLVITSATTTAGTCDAINGIQGAGLAKIGSDLAPSPDGGAFTGTISGQNVSISYTPGSNTTPVPIALTGTLSQDGSTISGTFSKTAYGCWANVTSGTFSFTQYPYLPTASSGTFTYGTSQVPFSISETSQTDAQANGGSITVGAIATTNCPASTYSMLTEQEGRFFHLWEANFTTGTTPLVVWGILNDPTGKTLDTFVMAQLNGYGGTQNPCFEPMSPLETTLTAQ